MVEADGVQDLVHGTGAFLRDASNVRGKKEAYYSREREKEHERLRGERERDVENKDKILERLILYLRQ